MVVVPQVLDLFWSAIEREVEKSGRTKLFDRLRSIARRLPMAVRRLIFRRVHAQLGGSFRLFVSAGAFLPPALQQAWEDMGVTVLQGYGATETGTGSCTTLEDHGLGHGGRAPEGIEMRLAADGEVQFRGATLFKGYWNAPELTAAAFTEDGWYKTGDIGHLDPAGRLILSGRKKDIIVLPNGFNVYPEDIENALRIAGPARFGGPRDGARADRGDPPGARRRPDPDRRRGARLRSRALRRPRSARAIDAAVKAANAHPRAEPADRRLAPLARVGLPAHAHAQGQARPRPRLGRRRCAAAGRASAGARAGAQPRTVDRDADRVQGVLDQRAFASRATRPATR